MSDPRTPRPARSEAPQWQSEDGSLILAKCEDCGEPHYYPRVICPFCSSDNLSWITCSGRGRIYSVSVFRRAEPPYALAYVTLDEGIKMMTNIVDCDLDAIRIDDPVAVVFKDRNGIPTPMFAPVQG
ncbi:Zn-ribbon domain-containing OB-fold protein [Seohaeicola nanhaiensis]|uniref:Zn-ribbon domain-containing OB-fold protein n=1 Tax=Seohaeicola nanhaiensis TaxID=1387282 RepID=A0ABV9KL31_9RHOB